MTHEKYHNAIALAIHMAGSADSGWNRRFAHFLEENGLELVFQNPQPCPDGNDYKAPVPLEGEWQYSYPAWIIPKN